MRRGYLLKKYEKLQSKINLLQAENVLLKKLEMIEIGDYINYHNNYRSQ